ncbi:ribose-phosphate diphosphokinase [Leptospira interrogans str. 2003000735]|uniref:ribose-phosphate diphosphokinase n=3 Tax=Leptospira interrogans TaxID=173 RepID=A0A829DAJ0_LEPIR|nr:MULTISPECIES: ribose-phosphate diphosphokinase [Leptospira]EMN29670.1 ribose-phosphate diphosphokinase [Leptospira interrogans serovar Pyrogenes str. L0374]EMY05246.1 ribose-phosphate diphosphokinase [Leptospira interrogans str. 2002000626]EMY27939.1 ribose-phosphate diphosphokinase [Leptospira interrogans serovar Australis str. 200703203]EKN85980.1 ribose-phosphate diphosphokinase [Leptospira interrogans str. 2002000624]EKO07125.1 ribose-phosphate diphosphokinase [Leptospira interrogans st
MNKILFHFPENSSLAKSISQFSKIRIGNIEFGRFPDGESKLRILENLNGSEVYILCSLDRPDSKIVALIFFCETARSLGAVKIHLIAPYLCYMRQDKIFRFGEGVNAKFFAKFISRYIDSILTIDPHLHRIHNLEEIFNIPSKVLHSTKLFAEYIQNNVSNPILIGPDSESDQWVREVADIHDLPFMVLEKNRKGDRDVDISVPKIEKYLKHTPVLIDDIISTGKTLIQTILHLKKMQMLPPVCICVHGIFADNSFQELMENGVFAVITTNSIEHHSNTIDLGKLIADHKF